MITTYVLAIWAAGAFAIGTWLTVRQLVEWDKMREKMKDSPFPDTFGTAAAMTIISSAAWFVILPATMWMHWHDEE